MKICLTDWKLAGYWPYTPIQNGSMETGHIHQGVTGIIDAKVPGSIYDDLLRAGIIEDPYFEMNSLKCEWVSNRWWTYQTSFSLSEDLKGSRIRLYFGGIDYKARIFVNDRFICEHEGMYEPVFVEMGEFARFGDEVNTVRVIIESAPDEMGQIGFTSRTFTQKARFTYKWDFCTRMVGMGLWEEVCVLISGDTVIKEIQHRYCDSLVTGSVLTSSIKSDDNARLEANLYYNETPIDNTSVPINDGKADFSLTVTHPLLWYPNGSGEQPLYDLKLSVVSQDGTVSDQKSLKIGLRSLDYAQCDDAIESALPYIPVINGKKIYIKGVNITPLDLMYGCVTDERYEKLIRLCKDANVNLIRVWGGGIIEKEIFYDLCDRYGIMVWQEFIQSSSGIDNVPSKRPEFLKLAAATAEWAVRARRNHVCLTYWSGGNELMDADGFPATYEDENIAMLREITSRLDPDRLMLPTSASGPLAWQDAARPELNHDVHGPWKYQGPTRQYTLYNNSPIQLHSEFGVDGMTNPKMLDRIFSESNKDRIYTAANNPVWRHHGEWWDTFSYRESKIFGDLNGCIDTLITVSQFMQAEGIRYALEANRRRQWKNCGSIVWQMNEPWPNFSCTSLLDYSMTPKLAYYFYRDAMKRFHISLKYDTITLAPGKTFSATPFVHDDDADVKNATICITAISEDNTVLGVFDKEVEFTVPEGIRSFTLRCEATSGDKKDINNYLFFVLKEGEPKGSSDTVLKFVQSYKESNNIQ